MLAFDALKNLFTQFAFCHNVAAFGAFFIGRFVVGDKFALRIVSATENFPRRELRSIISPPHSGHGTLKVIFSFGAAAVVFEVLGVLTCRIGTACDKLAEASFASDEFFAALGAHFAGKNDHFWLSMPVLP